MRKIDDSMWSYRQSLPEDVASGMTTWYEDGVLRSLGLPHEGLILDSNLRSQVFCAKVAATAGAGLSGASIAASSRDISAVGDVGASSASIAVTGSPQQHDGSQGAVPSRPSFSPSLSNHQFLSGPARGVDIE